MNQFDKLTGLFLFFSMSTIGIEIWWLEILNCVCAEMKHVLIKINCLLQQ